MAGPYVMLGGQTYTEVGPTETVSVPFTTADGAISVVSYSGLVKLTVAGVGESLGQALNDAFYIYTDGLHNPIAPLHDFNYYQLNVDSTTLVPFDAGRNATNFIMFDVDANLPIDPGTHVPAYRADHTYTFVINTHLVAPSTLHFGVADGNFGDNSGAYRIEVTQLQQVPEPASIVLLGTGLFAGVRRLRRRV